jgi:predicted nuclease of predicted toxin-antitoxin system
MRVLIDENLPRKLAGYLPGHECRTVAECGWAGKKNGELIALAEPLFDVLLTLDKSIPYQQNLRRRGVAVLIVHARSNSYPGSASFRQ